MAFQHAVFTAEAFLAEAAIADDGLRGRFAGLL
jgi:hypothetical protein